MQVKELGHLVLYVKDLARSRRFYGELLGWKEITPEGGMQFPAAAFTSGRTHHELLLIEVGPSAVVRNAIVDKNVVIEEGARVGVDAEADRKRFVVSDGGVVVIGKGDTVEA